MAFQALQCFGAYLPISENWIYQLLRQMHNVEHWLATDKFLKCGFHLPNSVYLRSPWQPRLLSTKRPHGWRRWMRALNGLAYPWYLRTRLRRQHIDVVHCHFANIGWKYRRLARFTNAPLIVSFYGWDYVRLTQSAPVWNARIHQLFQLADCMLCEGPHGASLLAGQGCPPTKIRVARLGVDVASIPFLPRSKQPGELRLVQVASFREKKGHTDTIEAFTLALRTCPNMHLTLIGATSGSVLNEVQAAIAAHRIEDQVTLQPGIPVARLHAELGNYHVFIHPSHHAADGDCEGGAPVVLLDAQATGLPIIATTHCDIPEEVIHGQTGMLCDERDVNGLARAIGIFYTMSQTRYDAFAQAARKHIERNFDARVCAAHVEVIYRQLADRH